MQGQLQKGPPSGALLGDSSNVPNLPIEFWKNATDFFTFGYLWLFRFQSCLSTSIFETLLVFPEHSWGLFFLFHFAKTMQQSCTRTLSGPFLAQPVTCSDIASWSDKMGTWIKQTCGSTQCRSFSRRTRGPAPTKTELSKLFQNPGTPRAYRNLNATASVLENVCSFQQCSETLAEPSCRFQV